MVSEIHGTRFDWSHVLVYFAWVLAASVVGGWTAVQFGIHQHIGSVLTIGFVVAVAVYRPSAWLRMPVVTTSAGSEVVNYGD